MWFCQNNRGCHVVTVSTVQNLVSRSPRNWCTVYNLIVNIEGCVFEISIDPGFLEEKNKNVREKEVCRIWLYLLVSKTISPPPPL
jgi:hypothetical protein